MTDQIDDLARNVRDMQLAAVHQQDLLDAALEQTFPASDPVSLPSFA